MALQNVKNVTSKQGVNLNFLYKLQNQGTKLNRFLAARILDFCRIFSGALLLVPDIFSLG